MVLSPSVHERRALAGLGTLLTTFAGTPSYGRRGASEAGAV